MGRLLKVGERHCHQDHPDVIRLMDDCGRSWYRALSPTNWKRLGNTPRLSDNRIFSPPRSVGFIILAYYQFELGDEVWADFEIVPSWIDFRQILDDVWPAVTVSP